MNKLERERERDDHVNIVTRIRWTAGRRRSWSPDSAYLLFIVLEML